MSPSLRIRANLQQYGLYGSEIMFEAFEPKSEIAKEDDGCGASKIDIIVHVVFTEHCGYNC